MHMAFAAVRPAQAVLLVEFAQFLGAALPFVQHAGGVVLANACGPLVAKVAWMRSTKMVKARCQLIGSRGWSMRARHRGVVRRLGCRVSPTVAPLMHTWPRDEGW